MGEVFKAQDTKLDRFVALKFLPSQLSATEDVKARFIQEAKTASAINHPNVCTIYSIEEYDDPTSVSQSKTSVGKQLFIVMEFVDGKALIDKKDTLSDKQKLEIGIQSAEGLAAAHEKGIVHRDIKPENIMIRKDGIVQIMDFGLAKLYKESNISRLTKAGSTVGTMGYMSPEQVQGLDVDHRTDIFSFGVVLYEMFAGVSPFKGMHETAIMYEIVNVDPPLLTSVIPELDPELERIILECLEKDPAERCQSAAELARNLRRIKRVSTGSRTASRIQQAVPIGNERKKEIKKWKWTSIVLAVLCLAAIAAFLFKSTSRNSGNNLTSYKYTPFETDGVTKEGAWSPDGKAIAFTKYSDGNLQLLMRSIDNPKSKLLAATESKDGFYNLFWDPDGNSIYYIEDEDGRLKNIGLAGGKPRTVFSYRSVAADISPDNKSLVSWAWAEQVDSTLGKYATLFISETDGSKTRAYMPDTFRTSGRFFPEYIHFSPDGSKIAVVLFSSKGVEFWILPWPDGPNAKPRKIFENIKFEETPKFEWLTDSKHIIFSLNNNMWIANTENEEYRKITSSVIKEGLAAISPDGKRLLIEESNENYDIVMLPFDGSPLKRVKTSSVDEYSATVSSDGKSMCYITDKTGTQEIWLVDEVGNESPVVSNENFPGSTNNQFPAAEISPDGKLIAYFHVGGVTSLRDLWVSNSEGGKPIAVFADSTLAGNFCWSPNSKSLYTMSIFGSKTICKIVPIGNGKTINLPDSASTWSRPAWSPDGKWIAFVKRKNTQYPKGWILLMSPYGKQSKEINSPVLTSLVNYSVTWSRNSKFLYIASSIEKESRLDVIDIETGKSRKIADYGYDVIFGYGQNQCAIASISRDGKGLIVTAQFANGSLYILDGALGDVK